MNKPRYGTPKELKPKIQHNDTRLIIQPQQPQEFYWKEISETDFNGCNALIVTEAGGHKRYLRVFDYDAALAAERQSKNLMTIDALNLKKELATERGKVKTLVDALTELHNDAVMEETRLQIINAALAKVKEDT